MSEMPPNVCSGSKSAARSAAVRPPSKWPIYVLLGVAIIVPALFWQRVWFGARLSDAEIRRRLRHPEEPRRLQHACEQLSRRMERDPEGARQFYQLLAALANDAAPRVRYNAALALARFRDPGARPVLREMLMPYAVSAQWEGPSQEGIVVEMLRSQDSVRPRMQLALVDTGEDQPKRVAAPLGGQVGQVMVSLGDRITKGSPFCTIQPSSLQVYETLRGLALVGQPQDLECVRRYFNPQDRVSHGGRTRIQAQAELAAAAIRRRQAQEKQNDP